MFKAGYHSFVNDTDARFGKQTQHFDVARFPHKNSAQCDQLGCEIAGFLVAHPTVLLCGQPQSILPPECFHVRVSEIKQEHAARRAQDHMILRCPSKGTWMPGQRMPISLDISKKPPVLPLSYLIVTVETKCGRM